MITSEDLYAEDMEDGPDIFSEEPNLNEQNAGDDPANEPGDDPTNEAGDDDCNKKTVKPKRVIRNPQPRLNAETLKGKRGLTALESYFDRVKFKGKGQEEQDLSVILKTYEYWCHRLFPKYPFDECIAKIETLGKKRPIVTHLKRIRADLLYEEPVMNDNLENEEISANNFDNLLEARPEITEEQLERIRINKEKAELIRRRKLQQTLELNELTSQEIIDHPHNSVEEDAVSIYDKAESVISGYQVEEDKDSTYDSCVSEERVLEKTTSGIRMSPTPEVSNCNEESISSTRRINVIVDSDSDDN